MRWTPRAVSAERDQEDGRSGRRGWKDSQGGEENKGEENDNLSKLGRHSSAVVCPEALLATIKQAIKQAMEKGSGQRKAMAPAKAVERMSDSASANQRRRLRVEVHLAHYFIIFFLKKLKSS